MNGFKKKRTRIWEVVKQYNIFPDKAAYADTTEPHQRRRRKKTIPKRKQNIHVKHRNGR